MNGLGLFSVLPAASLAGLALLVLAFAGLLGLRRPVPAALGVLLVAIIFCLDGVTPIVEPLPQVRDQLPGLRVRQLHQPDRPCRPRRHRLLQLAWFLRAGRPRPAGRRRAQPAPAADLVAGDHRHADRGAVPAADPRTADQLAGPMAGGAAALPRQLGRPGLLLAAVLQLPALPGLHRHPGDLVLRPAAAAPAAGDRPEAGTRRAASRAGQPASSGASSCCWSSASSWPR